MSYFLNPNLRTFILASAISLLAVSTIPLHASAQTHQRGVQRMMVDEFQVADDWGRRIQPNWSQYTQSLLREFNRLTPDDLARANGNRAAVLSAIQDRYNLSNERATDRLTNWQMRQR